MFNETKTENAKKKKKEGNLYFRNACQAGKSYLE